MKIFFTTLCLVLVVGCLSAQVSIINQINPTCSGICNGSVTFSISGGAAPYTISSVGTTSCTLPPFPPIMTNTITINGLCPCVYNFIVTDASFNVIGAQLVTMVTPPGMNAIITKTNVCCNGMCNGVAAAIVIGGTMPYTYSWSPGAGFTPTITNLCAGTYSLKVSDGAGCNATFTTQITQPPPQTATIITTPASCGLCCDGQISINASGGTPPYLYSLNGSPTTTNNVFTNLCTGNYTAVVTGSCCVTSLIASVTSSPTNVTELKNTLSVELVPNPVHDKLIIKTSIDNKNIDYKLYDLTGKLISGDIVSSEPINLEQVNAGNYLIRLIDNVTSKSTVRKITLVKD